MCRKWGRITFLDDVFLVETPSETKMQFWARMRDYLFIFDLKISRHRYTNTTSTSTKANEKMTTRAEAIYALMRPSLYGISLFDVEYVLTSTDNEVDEEMPDLEPVEDDFEEPDVAFPHQDPMFEPTDDDEFNDPNQ